MGHSRPRAEWRGASVSHSETLMPGEFTSPEQTIRMGSPRGLTRGAYGGPAKEAVERQIANIKEFVAARVAM